MLAFKLIAMGDEQGVVLAAELMTRLAVQADGTVLAEETLDGIKLLTGNAAHEAQMQVARRLMREREGVLRELAKI